MQFNNKKFGEAAKPFFKSPFSQDFIDSFGIPPPPPGSEVMITEDSTIMICEDGSIMITE